MTLSRKQMNFVDKSIHHPNMKKAISSPLEYDFKRILNAIGKEGEDWFHQPAYYDEENGLVAVPDFSFPKEKVIIELDGSSHKHKKQRERDIERDKVFYHNDFYVIRIPAPIEKERESYWKVYIQESLKVNAEILAKKDFKEVKKKLYTKDEFEKLMRKKMKNN